MIRSKVIDISDFNKKDFISIEYMFDKQFGKGWAHIGNISDSLRKWEYVNAIRFSNLLKSTHIKKVLDAGCGASPFPEFLMAQNLNVDAVDMGVSRPSKKNLRYQKMSMTDLKFNDNEFDMVFSIGAIEHVNAGKFAIPGFSFDTGDTKAMQELIRVLRPGGILCVSFDFADRYYPPPGLWISKSHRIYDIKAIENRLIFPCKNIDFYEEADFSIAGNIITDNEPVGFAYTIAMMTLKKKI